MHQETELIVTAIESLRQEPNIFKDYIFPIASAFFTSILGASIAYFVLNRQENLQLEKEKLSAANKWTLDIERARSSLISIKNNYHNELKSHPMQRLASIPSIIFKPEPVIENFQDLAFIVPLEKGSSTNEKWSQIPRINAMVSNYNSLLHMWEKRNELNEAFKQSILTTFGNDAFNSLSLKNAEQAFGSAGLIALIDLTERCIKLTDHIVIEQNDFLENFPDFAKTKINLKRLKNYGRLLSYSNNDNELLLESIKPETEVNFASVEGLYGENIETIRKRHSTGYE